MKTIKWTSVLSGWWTLIKFKLGYFSPETVELATYRASECLECPHNISQICNLCGCYLPAKRLVPTETCPDNRWVPVYYYLQGSNVIICEEVTPLLRERLYKYLGGRPENITVAKWEKFLNTF